MASTCSADSAVRTAARMVPVEHHYAAQRMLLLRVLAISCYAAAAAAAPTNTAAPPLPPAAARVDSWQYDDYDGHMAASAADATRVDCG